MKNLFNINDYRLAAKKRLPNPIYDYMAGGSDDEKTLKNNETAFDKYKLVPEVLVNVNEIDTSCSVLGADMKLPFYFSPSGGTGLFHPDKEIAVARAASDAGILFGLSTFSTTSIESLAEQSDCMKMFQIYIVKDRDLTLEFVHRAAAANYEAICVTVDSSISGNRERDLRSGLSFPPKLKFSTILEFARHLKWTMGFFASGKFEMANISHKIDAFGGGMNTFELAHHLLDTSVTWDDIHWLRQHWTGPFAIKGILSVEDAKKAVQIGATAIIVSTHGGRQLDSACAPIDQIKAIREAVGDKIEIILDSGVRRGTDIVKALALGADAVSFARPYIYGLAVGGQQGVTNIVDILSSELKRNMGLLGAGSISELGTKHILMDKNG